MVWVVCVVLVFGCEITEFGVVIRQGFDGLVILRISLSRGVVVGVC